MKNALGVVELVLAVGAVTGVFACWNAGVRTTEFAAVPDVSPAYAGTFYSGPWVAGATLAAIAAGLLMVDGIRRLRHAG